MARTRRPGRGARPRRLPVALITNAHGCRYMRGRVRAVCHINMRCSYCSLMVAMPINAQINARIQKRIVTRVSGQPRISK